MTESLHGLTKGTELEPLMVAMAQGEATGVMMYYALARLAKEQGLDEVANVFIESANQEAVHAGFYATLNGRYPKDFWQFVAGVAKAEYSGKATVKGLADKVRAAGFDKAADEMEIFAEQEWHHGVVIDELLKKFAPKKVESGKKWICSVCGYEHVGDAPPETCPVCGQPKSAFKAKIQIKAVRFYDGGFMLKSFACGGGLPEGSIKEEKLRSSLQNYVIDTGDEVILVDTGVPADFEPPAVTEKSVITFGDKIANYVDALKNLGYEPAQVSKILVTHKHPDHTGELRSFPNAKIFISRIEADDMNLTGDNVVRVDFTDGAYKNFPACQKIADGIYYIFAPGHTKGNSIVIVEDGEKFYMIHGDVTYSDEALLENKLSVVFEDLNAARDTLSRVRAFIKENKTVYLSTHTPLGYENLAAQKIMTLPDVDEAPIVETQTEEKPVGGKIWVCSICGYEHTGDEPPEICPRCKQPKSAFKLK
ncbi:MAG: MBL fold metallo-hydrolase [Selenomonadaceae bacterium]|nr:MBL fold metallo-hydrolase [Selenomonadaceae bacterium]